MSASANSQAQHTCLRIDKMTPVGLEPAIPGSVGRCLIHWATGPSMDFLTKLHFTRLMADHFKLLSG